MRILFLMLALGIILFISILVFVFIGYTSYVYYTSMRNASENLAKSIENTTNNIHINVSDYDILPYIQPVYTVINVALIFALIIAVAAIFMHTKKR